MKENLLPQKGGNKKTKHVKFSYKGTFLTTYTHTYVSVSGCKKYSFFGKSRVLFIATSVLRFALLLLTLML